MKLHTKLTESEQDECWSMLMNLNDEAIRYAVKYQPYDNQDSTIAKRLGLKVLHVRQFLGYKSINHLKQIDARIRKSTSGN